MVSGKGWLVGGAEQFALIVTDDQHHVGIGRLQRVGQAKHLAAEGTSFSALVNNLRCDLLARYLDDGLRPLWKIAALLGFSEPSAFSRWHRRQFGSAARQRNTKPVVGGVARKQMR